VLLSKWLGLGVAVCIALPLWFFLVIGVFETVAIGFMA
jgi:hypothetical protein